MAKATKPSTPPNLNTGAGPLEFSSALQELNTENFDTSAILLYDPTNQTALSYLRKKIEELYKTKTIPKSEYLGIVLSVQDEKDTLNNKINKRIIVDVPNKDLEGIVHQDYARIRPEFDLEHKVFYPVSEKVAKEELPHIGDVVRVSIPKDYFLSKVSNPRNNKYLGIFDNKLMAAPAPAGPANNRQAASGLGLSLAETQESLFSFKPTFPIEESDLVDIPLQNALEYPITSLPALRIPPKGSISEERGLKTQAHVALDLGTPEGTPVFACTDHTLIPTDYNGPSTDADPAKPGFGNYIKATNGKFLFFYGHLKQKILPSDGKNYKKGDLVGFSGNSGARPSSPYVAHLHFEIRDAKTNAKINPLYMVKGTFKLRPTMVSKFSFKTDTIQVPFKIDSNRENIGILNLEPIDPVLPSPERTFAKNRSKIIQKSSSALALNNTSASEQTVPTAQPALSTPDLLGRSASIPVSVPTIPIVKLNTDLASGVSVSSKRGAKFIKVREDIYGDLLKIKDYLNTYGCNFTFNYIDVSLKNNISKLSKVGLEIHLNNNAGLSLSSNYETDDYLIGPDYSEKYGIGYKLKVYAITRQNINVFNNKYIASNGIFDIYDIKDTYLKRQPKIIKVYKICNQIILNFFL